MRKEDYDVVIVGAGVAGVRLAALLDPTPLRVLLIEQKPKIDIHPRRFGTFTETAMAQGLEPFIDHYFDTWAFYGPSVKASRTTKKIMCLVNYSRYAKSLHFANVTLRTGIHLHAARRAKNGITLIADKSTYHANIVVDASGYSQIMSKFLGLPVSEQTGASYEVELKKVQVPDEHEASFILNFTVSNSGGWLYCLSDGKAQFGWADFHPESKSTPSLLRHRTRHALRTVYPVKILLTGGKIMYEYGRFGPTGNVLPRAYDNLLLIGDAGRCGTPVTLEGFRQALDSANMAFETLLAATKAQDFRKQQLRKHEQLFHETYGKYYLMHKAIRYAYLHWARNEEIDRWFENFKRLSSHDFFRMIKGEFTPVLVLKTLNPRLVWNLTLNMLNNFLPKQLSLRSRISSCKREDIDVS